MGRICVALHTFAEPHQSLVDDKGSVFTLGVDPACAASLFALGQTPAGRECSFAMSQSFYTFVGKQNLVESIVAHPANFEAVVMIDGDMGFSPKDFQELVDLGRKLGEGSGAAVVGAFYPSRQKVNEWIGTAVDADAEVIASGAAFPATYVGNGFCWVPTKVFRAMKAPWYSSGWGPDKKFELEDQHFCRKVLQETPFKIWGRSFDGVSHDFRLRRNMNTLFFQGGNV